MRPTQLVCLPLFFVAFILYSFFTSTDKILIESGINLQKKLQLYVLDGGTLENIDPTGFGLKRKDVSFYRFPAPAFLIVHPKGTLIWDTGTVPDSSWSYTGSTVIYKLVLPDRKRDITLMKPLKTQLAEIGYTPGDINYLALSHYHYDHTANAWQFANAIWLVRQNEHDAMFAQTPPGVTWPSTYLSLQKNKLRIITSDEYDVFGDGTVVIKSAPGHTPGHLVLFLKLVETGNIVLSGDLYHYPEEKTFDKVPTFEYDAAQTRATRITIDSFLKRTNAKLWIQHDLSTYAMLKKSSAYYE